MVKKKGKSKRTTLKDKYKMQHRVVETNRKRRKQTKRDAAAGKVTQKKKDPGIPNSWPFKQDLLKGIQRQREKQQAMQNEQKEKRKNELRALREHQEGGGTARTVQEMLEQASRDQATFEAKRQNESSAEMAEKSDGTKVAGQQSRRAYLRELKKVVDSADVLLQVLDARDPMGSRIHPSIENAILSRTDKRMVLVLNKIDLVPREVVGAWLTALRRSHPTIAIRANVVMDRSSDATTQESATSGTTAVGTDGLLQLLKNYARTGGSGGKAKTTIVAGVIGYPNCGKSSIINALKRSRAVGVSPRPGFTTSMQEVVLDRNVRLLDCPGVVFDDRSAMLGNCVNADAVDDPIPPIEALLTRCNHSSLLMTYNIPTFPTGDVMMFLALVARSYGRVLKGGIPDKVSAARSVLKDWNQGKIPYYTAPPTSSAPEVGSDAVVVEGFGKEFDLSKYDEGVLNGLKDMDEMDFVKLENGTHDATNSQIFADAMKYLAGEDGTDDKTMDYQEEAAEDCERSGATINKMAQAKDYDFDMM